MGPEAGLGRSGEASAGVQVRAGAGLDEAGKAMGRTGFWSRSLGLPGGGSGARRQQGGLEALARGARTCSCLSCEEWGSGRGG